MKFLSVCSGIEAASVAFNPLGWKALAFSEVATFPRAVLKHHYPDVPLYGDFTVLKDEPWIVDADMLCGGCPCQSFSVAGLRQSLADDRGNLTLQFILLADAIDNLRRDAGREPAWVLYENVPGILSTSDNAFGAFLGGLCGRDAAIDEPEGGWTNAGVVNGPSRCAAWRTLDAQYFGVAQRRKRVFVLALGGAGRWAAADALLPITESMSWNPAPSRGKGERPAPTIASRPSGGGGLGTDFDLDGGLIANALTDRPDRGGGNSEGQRLIPVVAGTMKACAQSGGFSNSADHASAGYMIPVVMAHGQPNAEVVSDGEPSLTCNHEAPIVFKIRGGGEGTGERGGTVGAGGGVGYLGQEECAFTLSTHEDQHVMAPMAVAQNQRGELRLSTTSPQRGAGGGKPGEGYPAAIVGMAVRRLTPRECERLQAFPDDYTMIPWRGKPAEQCPDGPRYKGIGNSWATVVPEWIGRRIAMVEEILQSLKA